MSLFNRIFGKNAKDKPPTPQEAIQRIREVEELLSKKSDFLEKKIEQELDVAKKHGTKNKRLALQALKRKKRYENQLTQIDGTLTTLEYQREVLENASTNSEVLKVMSSAAKAFKGANGELDVDKVHDLMDDISEQQQLASEISTAISNPVGFDNDVDEDELMKELTELEQEELEKELIDIPTPGTSIPAGREKDRVPAKAAAAAVPKKRVDDDEDELKRMADWAS